MNCTQVEKLLPLYVGGDLKDCETERAVDAHLSSCDACRHSAAEFRASQDLLHGFGAPEFDAAFYDGIRRAVLTEIARRAPERPAFLESFRLFLFQRPALAASALLLLLVSALLSHSVLQGVRNSRGSSHLAAVENGFGEISPTQFDEDAPQIKNISRPVNEPRERKMNVPLALASAASRRRGAQTSVRDDARTEVSNSSGVNNSSSVNSASPVARDVPRDEDANNNPTTNNAATTQAIARMEIRTSDPNIRIIWLGRKAGE